MTTDGHRGGAQNGAFGGDFCGGSRKYIPEVGKLYSIFIDCAWYFVFTSHLSSGMRVSRKRTSVTYKGCGHLVYLHVSRRMSSANAMKLCPTCERTHNSKNFARHLRTCRGNTPRAVVCTYCRKSFRKDNLKRHIRKCTGEKSKAVACTHCLKSFRKDNIKRHISKCKKGDRNKTNRISLLAQRLENTNIENRSLHSRLIVLQMQLCKEKDDKLEHIDRLCKEKDDKLALRHQLSATKELMARRELEFTEELSALKVRLVTATAPRTTIHNTNYVLHMIPWCLDATSPGYEACLQADSDAIRLALNAVIPANTTTDDYYKVDEQTRGKYRSVFTKYIMDSVLHGQHPRYVVPDLARLKGVYVMPGGEVKCDIGMALFMRHHFKIQMKSPVLRYDEYLLKKSNVLSLKRLYGSEGHSGANRVQDMPGTRNNCQ